MKQHLKTLATRAAGVGLFLVGCVMAVLGFWVILALALFALAAIGLALIASPLVAVVARDQDEPAQTASV